MNETKRARSSPNQPAKLLFKQEFQARADQLKAVRQHIETRLIKEGLERELVDRIVLAVNEACANIIQHGYQRSQAGSIGIEIFSDCSTITFRLTDTAPTVNPAMIKSRPLNSLRPGGLGLHFINEIMDEVIFSEGEKGFGNLMLMKKQISAATS